MITVENPLRLYMLRLCESEADSIVRSDYKQLSKYRW